VYKLRIGEVYWPWFAGTEEQLFRMAFRFAREFYVEEHGLYDWQDEFLPRFAGHLNTIDNYVLIEYTSPHNNQNRRIKVYFEEFHEE
jgi:hypothetical protein